MKTTEEMMRRMIEVRKDYGTIPCLIAFAVWLKVEDERVLEMARVFVSKLKDPMFAPDWIRILANASSPSAILDANDDMMTEEL